MSINKNKSIIIDGRGVAFVGEGINICEYEAFMSRQGYSAVPKENIDSITKQDLIDHPEKFRPYTYAKCSNYYISYKEFAEFGLKYLNGRLKCEADNHIALDKDIIVSDLVYMRIHYPNLYDELLKKSDLPDIFAEVEKQYTKENLNANNQSADSNGENTANDTSNINGTGGNTKSIITPDEVNEDEMPEEITYIKKKMKGGVVYVPKTEEPVKAKDNKPKQEAKERVEINYTYIPESSDLKL